MDQARHPVARPAPDGRNCESPHPRRPHHRLRRTHQQPLRPRSAPALHHHPRTPHPRLRRPLRVPPHGGNFRALRPRHDFARRPPRGHGRPRHAHPRRRRPTHGRPQTRGHLPLHAAPARRPRPRRRRPVRPRPRRTLHVLRRRRRDFRFLRAHRRRPQRVVETAVRRCRKNRRPRHLRRPCAHAHLSAPGHRSRHRALPRGPQERGHHPRALRARKHQPQRPPAQSPRRPFHPRGLGADQRPRAHRPTPRQNALGPPAHPQPLRRQPAEGHPRPVALRKGQRPPPRRAHPRHRRRREERDLHDHAGPRPHRRLRHCRLERTP